MSIRDNTTTTSSSSSSTTSSSSSSCHLYSTLILRQCSDTKVLLQACTEVILHLEEGTFQIQRPSQQYYYSYLEDAKTAPSIKLCIVCIWYPCNFLVRVVML